jgi:MFS family permease
MGTAAEVVALLVAGPLVDKVGRHTVVSMGLLLGGGACLACANVPGTTVVAVLAAIGKFGCSGEFCSGGLLAAWCIVAVAVAGASLCRAALRRRCRGPLQSCCCSLPLASWTLWQLQRAVEPAAIYSLIVGEATGEADTSL